MNSVLISISLFYFRQNGFADLMGNLGPAESDILQLARAHDRELTPGTAAFPPDPDQSDHTSDEGRRRTRERSRLLAPIASACTAQRINPQASAPPETARARARTRSSPGTPGFREFCHSRSGRSG